VGDHGAGGVSACTAEQSSSPFSSRSITSFTSSTSRSWFNVSSSSSPLRRRRPPRLRPLLRPLCPPRRRRRPLSSCGKWSGVFAICQSCALLAVITWPHLSERCQNLPATRPSGPRRYRERGCGRTVVPRRPPCADRRRRVGSSEARRWGTTATREVRYFDFGEFTLELGLAVLKKAVTLPTLFSLSGHPDMH